MVFRPKVRKEGGNQSDSGKKYEKESEISVSQAKSTK